MIEFYYAPTPNGWKVAIMLEECALAYTTHLVRLGEGDQFRPALLAISPNAKMPAILDSEGPTGTPVPVFESGAILIYLAEKTGRFMPTDPIGHKEMLEWMFWQAANQGPIAGQLSHFRNYAPKGQEYSLNRYAGEYERNMAVLERRLKRRPYILGDDYGIVDMLTFPWAFIAKNFGCSLEPFPAVSDWRARIKERPAVRRAIDLHKDDQNRGQINATNNQVLYNQSAAHFRDLPDA